MRENKSAPIQHSQYKLLLWHWALSAVNWEQQMFLGMTHPIQNLVLVLTKGTLRLPLCLQWLRRVDRVTSSAANPSYIDTQKQVRRLSECWTRRFTEVHSSLKPQPFCEVWAKCQQVKLEQPKAAAPQVTKLAISLVFHSILKESRKGMRGQWYYPLIYSSGWKIANFDKRVCVEAH